MARMVTRRPSGGRPSPSSPGGSGKEAPKVEVPRHNTDPVWSLCPWPLTVQAHGQQFEVDAVPAVTWLRYLLPPPQTENIDLLGLVEDLVPDLEEFWFEEGLPPDELVELALEIVATVAARPWWIALRLMAVASNSWQVLGPRMFANGGDATKLSLAGWLDILLYQIMDAIEPEKATMFTMQLEIAPRDMQNAENDPMAAVPETSRDAFLAMAG